MEGLVPKLIDLLKSSVTYVFGVALASGILFFAPACWLAKMRLDQFVDNYRGVIGVVFFFSGSLALVETVSWLWGVLKFRKKIKSTIYGLDVKEKAVLREFFLEDRHTLVLPKEHPVVAGLISERILEVVGSDPVVWDLQMGYTRWSVRINSEISRYLSPEMLGMPSKPAEEELRELRGHRPDFL